MNQEIKWKKLVSRPMHPLTTHMMIAGHGKIFDLLKEKFLFKWKFETINLNGNVFVSEDSFQNLTNVFINRLKEDKNFAKVVLSNGLSGSDSLISTAAEVAAGNLSELSNEQLAKRFLKYVGAFFDFVPGLMIPLMVEQYLTNNVKQKITEEQFSKLMVVRKDSDELLEQKESLELAIMKQQGKNISVQLAKHAEHFGYMGLTNSFTSKPWDAKYFESILEQFDDPAGILQKLLASRKRELNIYSDSVKALDAPILKEVELLQDYMLFRTYRIGAMKKAQWALKPLLEEIASRAKLGFEDLIWFIWPEIIELLNSGRIPDFVPRKKFFAVSVIDSKVFWNSDEIKEEVIEYARPLKWMVACQGLAVGKVKLILSARDADKMQQGDVLVATMTTPDLVMAMKKSAAIVTDEGGILCHAAIVSREFGIPCVVGTNIATKAFKDGDFIRVDARKGVVEKISKS